MYKAIKKNFLGAKLLYYSILSNSGDASICLYSLNLVKNMQSSAVRLKKKKIKKNLGATMLNTIFDAKPHSKLDIYQVHVH